LAPRRLFSKCLRAFPISSAFSELTPWRCCWAVEALKATLLKLVGGVKGEGWGDVIGRVGVEKAGETNMRKTFLNHWVGSRKRKSQILSKSIE
jgi:hypothetical protein